MLKKSKKIIVSLCTLTIIGGVSIFMGCGTQNSKTSSNNSSASSVIDKNNEQENTDASQENKDNKQETKDNTQENKDNKKNNTYTSEKLGISFDIPEDWNDKYVIKDDDESIIVYMKNKNMPDEKDAMLFTITVDQNLAEHLDTIGGIEREQTLNGKKVFVGGPTDFRMIENDPLNDLYKKMHSERKDVLLTLR